MWSQGHLHQVIPDAIVGLVASRRADGETRLTLQGPRLDPLWIPVGEGDRFWGVRFWPDAGGPLLGQPARSLLGVLRQKARSQTGLLRPPESRGDRGADPGASPGVSAARGSTQPHASIRITWCRCPLPHRAPPPQKLATCPANAGGGRDWWLTAIRSACVDAHGDLAHSLASRHLLLLATQRLFGGHPALSSAFESLPRRPEAECAPASES